MTRSPSRHARRTAASVALLLPALALVGPVLTVTATPATAAASVPLTVGADDLGQQGNGAGPSRAIAGPVSGPTAVQVASGRDHGYLLDEGGRVWAWGDNSLGQIGDGTSVVRTAPVELSLTDVLAVESGHYHGLAIRSGGTVWTWGYGTLGQLGLGTTTTRRTPTQVAGLTGIRQVVAGRDMSYALTATGTVLAWGNNVNGEIGDGTTTRRTSPVPVPGLSGIVELSAGRNHALALDASGGVWAWGDNQYGQVGNGSTVDARSPVRIASAGYAHVDAGAQHSIGVRADGTVATWGRGYRGALGLGSTATRLAPTVVPGLSGIVDAGDGRDQSFAITADGHVWAWGYNSAGELGDGTTTQRSSPVLLPLTGIADAVSGSAHTIFLPAAPGGNIPPTAAFTSACTGLACAFDASGSTDVDGTVVAYAWAFGDGTTGEGSAPAHVYAEPGTYVVTLTVTDDGAATGAVVDGVTVTAPAGNVPPTASFTPACTGLACAFDASGSTDVDGTVVAYAWAFGDGTTGEGSAPAHLYAEPGTYVVTLTVTDDDAATGARTVSVTVAEPGTATPVAYVASAVADANALTHRVTIPASVAAGDGLVLALTVNTSAAVAAPAGVTGWTLVEQVAGIGYSTTVWTRTAAIGDAGAVVSVGVSALSKGELAVGAYRSTGPGVVTASAGALETVSRAAHTTPAVPVAAEGSVLVSIWSDKSSATTAMTAPLGTTARLLSSGSSGGRITLLWADSAPAPGTAGGLVAVADSASSKATMVSLVLAPRP